MYNDRRFYFGGGPGIVPNDSFGSAASANAGADRRDSRSRGTLVFEEPFLFNYLYTWEKELVGWLHKWSKWMESLVEPQMLFP